VKVPAGLNIEEAKLLLKLAKGAPGLGDRIDLVSGSLIGRPYVGGPLGGGPDLPEVFTATLDGFDCVTYIETVLALALSRGLHEFLRTLRLLRYKRGEVAWASRNHYMVDWARNNSSAGFIKNLTSGRYAVKKERTLSLVPGLPEKRVSFACFPKRKIGSVRTRINTGDLILFASARKRLDVFHAGLLLLKDGRLLFRHATRSIGAVVEQPLAAFLSKNRMSGFILLRPLESGAEKALHKRKLRGSEMFIEWCQSGFQAPWERPVGGRSYGACFDFRDHDL
jgi:hypothetical protein